MTEESVIMTYCVCGKAYELEQFMIECDVCRKWYHGECIGIKEYMSMDLDKYHCLQCETIHGPSIAKVHMNLHRHEYTEIDAESKPVQTGTPVFIEELNSRHFQKADEIIKQLRGQQLTLQYLQTHGFETPILIDGKDGLDMTVPASNFSVYDVESYIGGNREIDVIDVTRQSNIRMKLRDFVEYYNDPHKTRVFNVISLEFTDTGLSPLIEAPYIARKLDWVNSMWPRDMTENSEIKRPEIQKYCLMGVKNSFTDFHIDFGGTSVWYHVLRGEKVFYLIRPTSANIQLYHQWMNSSSQSETFFGDQADACYKCVIKQGQTMMIPTGWIHAVLTPVDSLVFGGNFIHSLNIPMQIQIYELERKMKTPKKFQYPSFETIHWFAAKRLLKELKDLNTDEKKCPGYFLQGVKCLQGILKQWNTDKDYSTISRGQIPNSINSQKLLKDFSKEIRHAERFLLALNPPKPERESKRKKKKPINKDFIDYETRIKTESLNKSPIKLKLPVIRFKLGDNEIIKEAPKEFAWKQTSIYDFHDGSNDDEVPQPKRKKSSKTSANKKSQLPKNGIEELLKASAYTSTVKSEIASPSPSPSPSTREAIAGMLSISEQCYSSKSESQPSVNDAHYSNDDDEDSQLLENSDQVHQDEDFIYPALDASDDEEYIFKPRGKRRVDEAWNPKARVGPLLPKINRPAREGVKKTAVEKGLEAAAAKRAKHPPNTKRVYNKQKKKVNPSVKPSSSDKHDGETTAAAKITTFTSILSSPNRLKDVKAKLAAPVPVERKPRKGMKTAKQRLGKILKLHRMMH